MARYGSRHHHPCQQVLDMSKDEGRLPEAIRFTSTTINTPLEMGKYSHGFYHKTTKDNKQLRHDLVLSRVKPEEIPIRAKRLLFLGMEPRSTTSFTSLKNWLKLEIVSSLAQRSSMRQQRRFFKSRAISKLPVIIKRAMPIEQSSLYFSRPLTEEMHVRRNSCHIPWDGTKIDNKLHFIEEPVEIETVRSNVESKVISLSSKFVETQEEGPSPPWDVKTSSKEYPHPFSKIRNRTECHVLSFEDKALLTGKGCDTP
ncbi:hypothetical protein Tco_0079932 [Tanacetum coccineum]